MGQLPQTWEETPADSSLIRRVGREPLGQQLLLQRSLPIEEDQTRYGQHYSREITTQHSKTDQEEGGQRPSNRGAKTHNKNRAACPTTHPTPRGPSSGTVIKCSESASTISA